MSSMKIEMKITDILLNLSNKGNKDQSKTEIKEKQLYTSLRIKESNRLRTSKNKEEIHLII